MKPRFILYQRNNGKFYAEDTVDRQAVFRRDCATCHVNPGLGKIAKELYAADCGVCHESEHRATMVPDLHALKEPTNIDFWRQWIKHGKTGTLMPAFGKAEGGPLEDSQIDALTRYINWSIPSKASETNALAK
jgi:mono/diheme cytochrome c family protein